jgi:hypothetical protein
VIYDGHINSIFCILPAHRFMKKRKPSYGLFKKISAGFLLLALAWLTISAQFIYTGTSEVNDHVNHTTSLPSSPGEEAQSSPLNNAEEEASASSNMVDEYLHDYPISRIFWSLLPSYNHLGDDNLYIAYHGELLVPPPNSSC